MILSRYKVVATGSNRTRLINKLNNKNITIYNLVTFEKTTFWVNAKDYKTVKHFAEIYSVQVEIEADSGLSKALRDSLKNLPYMIAAVVCFIILLVSTNFVYNIKVEAQNDIYANKVQTLLNENKLKVVIQKNKINLKEIENLILNNVDEVSFATCYIEGFSLMVKIVANDNPKQSETKKVV